MLSTASLSPLPKRLRTACNYSRDSAPPGLKKRNVIPHNEVSDEILCRIPDRRSGYLRMRLCQCVRIPDAQTRNVGNDDARGKFSRWLQPLQPLR